MTGTLTLAMTFGAVIIYFFSTNPPACKETSLWREFTYIIDYIERIYISLYVSMLSTYTFYEDKLKHNHRSPHCNFLATDQLYLIQDAKKCFAPKVVVFSSLYLLMICSADITCRSVFWVKRKSISASQQKSAAAAAAESSCRAKPRSKRSKPDLLGCMVSLLIRIDTKSILLRK